MDLPQEQPVPRFARAFLCWRLECIDSKLALLGNATIAAKDAGREDLLEQLKRDQETLEAEKLHLLMQNRFLAEDI